MTSRAKKVSQTQWYISVETPAPLAQPMGSPVPPPRQRHNPFNKLDVNPHQRSHSLRSAPGRMDDNNTNKNEIPSQKASINFWELHNSYGRPILSDLNSWKHTQRLQKEKSENLIGNLINL